MQTYYTTSTGPGWSFNFTDSSGNVPPGFSSATFAVIFRSVNTLQTVQGTGTFSGANAGTGIVSYTIGVNGGVTDFANAYKLASPAMLPGDTIIEVLGKCTANGLEYDGGSVFIKVRKI